MITFTTRLQLDTTKKAHHHVVLPDEVVAALGAAKRKRVRGTVNGIAVNRSLYGHLGDQLAIIIGKAMLSDLKARSGDMVTVALEIDPNPDQVELPEELVACLDQMPLARAKYYELTPGKQRSLTIYVNWAKSVDARIKRSIEICTKLENNTLEITRKKNR